MSAHGESSLGRETTRLFSRFQCVVRIANEEMLPELASHIAHKSVYNL